MATISMIFLRINSRKLRTKMTKQFFAKKQTDREKRRRQYNVFSTQQILLQEHQAENTGKNGLLGLTATLTDREFPSL